MRKEATKAYLMTVILLSSSKETQPEEPTKGGMWTHALDLSEAIVDSVSKMMVQISKTFLERSASPVTLSQTECQSRQFIACGDRRARPYMCQMKETKR
jgi:hypothetical protein